MGKVLHLLSSRYPSFYEAMRPKGSGSGAQQSCQIIFYFTMHLLCSRLQTAKNPLLFPRAGFFVPNGECLFSRFGLLLHAFQRFAKDVAK